MNAAPTTDWQTWTALAVVALTALAFVIRIYLRKKNASSSSCHSDCGCAKPVASSNLQSKKPSP